MRIDGGGLDAADDLYVGHIRRICNRQKKRCIMPMMAYIAICVMKKFNFCFLTTTYGNLMPVFRNEIRGQSG